MSLPRSLCEHVQNAASYTVGRILGHAHLSCDIVGGNKAHSLNIFSQPVWVFLHNGIEGLAVGVINLDGKSLSNAVLAKEKHGIPQVALFLKLHRYLHGAAHADALYLGQPFGLFLDDP